MQLVAKGLAVMVAADDQETHVDDLGIWIAKENVSKREEFVSFPQTNRLLVGGIEPRRESDQSAERVTGTGR